MNSKIDLDTFALQTLLISISLFFLKRKVKNRIAKTMEEKLGEIGKKKPKIISKLSGSFDTLKSDKFFLNILSVLIRI